MISFPGEFADGNRQYSVLCPGQVRYIAEATAGQHRPVHSVMLVIRQHTAHASTFMKQTPAHTIAAPGEITDQLGANR